MGQSPIWRGCRMNNLTFDEATHIYTLDGIQLPSVTEITRFCAYDYKSDRP